MHDGEIDIDGALVQQLLTDQFPALADLPIRAVRSMATVNAVFRLGDDLCVRLPRMATSAESLETELQWLPPLAPRLSLRVPRSVHRGSPTATFPLPWAVYDWIDGRTYADELVDDERRARGIALHQAVMIIPYYREPNPGFVTLASHTVQEILADIGA